MTTVEVDTETGTRAVIAFDHDPGADTYTLHIAGRLLDQAPEAVTAAIQLAVLELRNWRPSVLGARLRQPTAIGDPDA